MARQEEPPIIIPNHPTAVPVLAAPIGPLRPWVERRRAGARPTGEEAEASGETPPPYVSGPWGIAPIALDPDRFARGARRLRLKHAAAVTGAMALAWSLPGAPTVAARKERPSTAAQAAEHPTVRADVAAAEERPAAVDATTQAPEGLATDRPPVDTPAAPAEPAALPAAPPTTAPPNPPPAAEPAPEPEPEPEPWRPAVLAEMAGVPIFEPSQHIRLVGFHEAYYNVALPLVPADPPAADHGRAPIRVLERGHRPVAPSIILPTRNRTSHPASAIDIAIPVDMDVLTPVTGTVTRVVPYLLYGKYPDTRIEITPDGQPHLQVTVLHVSGPMVVEGQHVIAGQDLLATTSTPFPFESQIDRFLRALEGIAMPHVHIEIKHR